MNIVFDVYILDESQDNLADIARPMQDFLNHIDIRFGFVDVIDYMNCVAVAATCSDGNITLVFDSKERQDLYYLPETIMAYVQDKRNLTFRLVDKNSVIYEYKKMLTRQNFQSVLSLRQNLVDSITNEELKYVNISKLTKNDILNGTYKMKSEEEISNQFLNASLNETKLPTQVLNVDKEYTSELTFAEQMILNARSENFQHRKHQVQVIFDAKNDCVSKEKIEESKTNEGRRRQTSIVDFDK